MRLFSRRWLVAPLLGAAGLSACSVLYDLSADQCETNADCQALGEAFTDRVCSEGLCVEPDEADGPCKFHRDCMEAPDAFGAAACIDGECVDLITDQCRVLLPLGDDQWLENLRADDPIILGGYASIPAEGTGIQIRNYDLVLTEFTLEAGGLRGTAGTRRPLVAVVCDANPETPEELEASISHLVDDLHVPGIVAGLRSGDLQAVFEGWGLENEVLFVSPVESDTALTTLSDEGLMWHMLPGGREIAVTYAPLLDRTIDYLDIDGDVRVAMVTASDIGLLFELQSGIEEHINFNGKSATQNFPDNYRRVDITSQFGNPEADYGDAIAAIVDFEPHVLIAAAADEFLTSMLPAIEAQLSDDAPRPFYLLSPIHYNNPNMPERIKQEPALAYRMAGVNAAAATDTSLYDAYQIAFDSAYPEVAGESEGFENFYDAAYFLVYSAAAAGSVPFLTGRDMARGMTRLLSGPTTYGVGRRDMTYALQALENPTSKITLNGTLGPPDFEPSTGVRRQPGSVWCIDEQGVQFSDVLRYDPETQELTGDFPCIDGF